MRVTEVGTLLALSLAVAGCGDGSAAPTSLSSPATSTGSTTTVVTITDNNYSPKTATVAAGTTVTWNWAGRAQHAVTFDDGPGSPTQASGSYQRTFVNKGAFAYHCAVHGRAMSGTITVQ